jgi:P27 family predicted phage terminase small subunit
VTRGRKPKPTRIREIEGNPGRRPLNDSEPQGRVLSVLPDPPSALGPAGRAAWSDLGGQMLALGMLEDRYLPALELCCGLYDEVAGCDSALVEFGSHYYTTTKGTIASHPAVRRRTNALDGIRRYLIEFGLTPSASSRIKVSVERPADKLAAFAARKPAKRTKAATRGAST